MSSKFADRRGVEQKSVEQSGGSREWGVVIGGSCFTIMQFPLDNLGVDQRLFLLWHGVRPRTQDTKI